MTPQDDMTNTLWLAILVYSHTCHRKCNMYVQFQLERLVVESSHYCLEVQQLFCLHGMNLSVLIIPRRCLYASHCILFHDHIV